MDWVSKKAGWQVDPQLICTAVPDTDLDIDEGAVRLPPLPRCERCTRLERELVDARGRADAAWARSLLDRDRVAEAESQLDWLRHAAGRSVGKESELAFLEDEREKLGALVEAHKERADDGAAELMRLRNRELTRDDVGDGLRAGLLECTTAALGTARRQIARTRDLLAKVTTMAVSPRGVGGGGGSGRRDDPGALAYLIGTAMAEIEADALAEKTEGYLGDVGVDGGDGDRSVDDEIERLRAALAEHEAEGGPLRPPKEAEAAAAAAAAASGSGRRGRSRSVTFADEEGRRAASASASPGRGGEGVCPLRMAEQQAYIGELLRAVKARDGTVEALGDALAAAREARERDVAALQTQLDAAHAAMGLSAGGGGAGRSGRLSSPRGG